MKLGIKWLAAASMATGTLLVAGSAGAQGYEGETRPHEMRAADRSLELSIATGYAEGFGNVGAGARSLQDLSAAGGGVQLGIGYRIVPNLTLGAYGSGAAFGHGGNVDRNTNLQSWTAGVEAGWHFLPTSEIDPVVSLGTGWRAYGITTPNGDTWQHGLELARLQFALDYRLTPHLAISPVVGADMSLFLTQWAPGDGSYQPISSPNVNTFVFAGVLGRFDVATSEPRVAKIRPPPEPIFQPVGVTAPQPQSDIGMQVPPSPEPQPVSPSLAVSEEILRACKLSLDAIEKAPKFEFDKSELQSADLTVLAQIGDCFTTGPLKDKEMVLVGRADPRGTVAYNEALGLRRANRVARFLEGYGVSAGRIERTSRGKLDARGRDEVGWTVDRRVDILER
jgi:outer membrane protein OmpA-like peptidoglycan-associated protein